MHDGQIIGVDHGYSSIKTPHFTFHAGVVAYDYEPYTRKDVLEYGGKYYVVGSGRQPLQEDKTLTEDYYLMTLAALAKEIAFRHMDRVSRVHVAAGLPLTRYGPESEQFQNYLLRNRQPVSFRYEGLEYTVTITEVSLFPQGYSAYILQTDLRQEPSIIVADCGGWTVDIMRVDNKKTDAASCFSEPIGMIQCLGGITEGVRRKLGLSVTEAQIESVLRGDVNSIPGEVKEIVNHRAEEYVSALLAKITEHGMDYRVTPTVFLGGGAALMKRYVPAGVKLFRPIILDDVRLNAKAYERIAESYQSRPGSG